MRDLRKVLQSSLVAENCSLASLTGGYSVLGFEVWKVLIFSSENTFLALFAIVTWSHGQIFMNDLFGF